jgi:hypothetical protein
MNKYIPRASSAGCSQGRIEIGGMAKDLGSYPGLKFISGPQRQSKGDPVTQVDRGE